MKSRSSFATPPRPFALSLSKCLHTACSFDRLNPNGMVDCKRFMRRVARSAVEQLS
jgi:hypothetical protein